MQPNIVTLNAMLPTLEHKYQALGFNISFHDPNPACNFTADDYWTWGIHFTESGFQKIAASWWTALEPVIQPESL
jgi:hypothetical protein